MDADARPSNVGPPFTGHFKVIADTPRGLQPWNPAVDPVVLEGKANKDTDGKVKAPASGPKLERNIEIGRNAYEANGKEIHAAASKPTEKQANGDTTTPNGDTDTSAKVLDDLIKGPKEKIHCFTCGVDCTRVYYHNGKAEKGAVGAAAKVKYNVCPNCFIELRLPANQDSSLFVKMENPSYSTLSDRDTPWDDAEILLLLEGLEKFDDSWADIAEHVGTRTREECVLKFLQLEIEDKYLDAEPTPNGTTGLGLLGTQGGYLPFTQADNPVMSVVGFLASLTDPGVAAAAAGKSVEEMKRSLREKLEKPSDGTTESDKTKEKELEDAMEIDTTGDVPTTNDSTASPLATIPLAATAARSAALASHEEREMTRLVSAAVNVTLQKFEKRTKEFD